MIEENHQNYNDFGELRENDLVFPCSLPVEVGLPKIIGPSQLAGLPIFRGLCVCVCVCVYARGGVCLRVRARVCHVVLA